MRRTVRYACVAVAMQLVAATGAAAAPTFVGFTEGTSPTYQHFSGSTMWVNTAVAGNFTVSAEEHPADTSVVFPALGTGWTGGATVTASAAAETMTYDWAVAAASPGAVLITSNPSATTVGFTVATDTAVATGGSVSYATVTNGTSTAIDFAAGSDAGSGIATWQLQRREAPLASNTCGTYTAFANLGAAKPAGTSYSDATIASGNCYQYQLVVTDNVLNVATFISATELKVDAGAPTGGIDATPASPFRGSVIVTGTSGDALTSVADIDVAYAGPVAGDVCLNLTAAAWSCPAWNTASVPDGTYTLTATITDAAGNTFSPMRSVVIDNTVPVTSVASITETTGAAFQHVIGTTLFFNPGQAGSSTVEVSASDVTSGVKDVTFPNLGTGWTPAGSVDNTPTPYAVTYAWAFGAVSPGPQNAVTADNAGNTANAPFTVTADSAGPSGLKLGYTDGYITTTSTTVTINQGTDAGSGVGSWQLRRSSAPLSGGTCGTFSLYAAIGAANPAGSYTDTTLVNGTCYKYGLVSTDNVGNGVGMSTSQVLKVATEPPAAGFVSWTETTNPGFQHSSANTLWYNPTQSGTATIAIAASDPVAGIFSIAYPDLDDVETLWTPAGSTGTAVSQAYSWTSGAANPGAQAVTVTNNAGKTAPVPFTVTADAAAATGGSLSYPGGYRTAANVPVTFASGSDAASGIGSWQLQRRSAALSGGACGAFGAFANVGPANPASVFTDATVADGTCYQYQLLVLDNVGNLATFSSTTTVQVDTTLPTGSVAATPASPLVGAVALSGTAADATSGVANVDVTYSGAASGAVCMAAATPTSWSCSWDTSAVADGTYTITSTITDAAGNVGTATRSVLVDNGGPTASTDALSEGNGSQFQHVAGSTLWFNPAAAGSFTVRIAASDNGSGIQRVDFPDLDGAATSWTPAGGSDTTPAYEQVYAWVAGASAPGAQRATAFDTGGITAIAGFTILADADAPAGGSIAYPEMTTVAPSVTFTAGEDAASGIDSSQLQRRSATLVDGVCGSYGAFADLGAANAASPIGDTSVAAGNCYQYRLVVKDRVANAVEFSSSTTLRIDEFPMMGTSGSDRIVGTSTNDEIMAGAGSDTIFASAGDDTIDGGPGIDTLVLAACNGASVNLARGTLTGCGRGTTTLANIERVIGSAGNDIITGSCGPNVLLGGGGNDVVNGGCGNDLIGGGDGNDRLSGGPGIDRLVGGDGNDRLSGGSGVDRLIGGDGADSMEGGAGVDRLEAGAGNDIASGGDGADTILAGAGNDRVIGGTGNDRVSAGSGNDIVMAGAGRDIVHGEAGNDQVIGGGGPDRLDGGAGSDRVAGGAGADYLLGGDGRDELRGGDGPDVLFGGFGRDHLVGGLGADRYVGGTGQDTSG